MPSESIAQRELFAIAEHHPDKLKSKNQGLLKLSHQQLHDFASTKGLKIRHVGVLSKAKKKAQGS
jgi:hypothetical protein